jgi:chemotaxis response regulator CheB
MWEPTAKHKLMDSGANCSMAADISLLQNVQKLDQPIVVGSAITEDGETSATECIHVGDLEVICDDGSSITTMCFYNPSASDTIVSPQSIIDQSKTFDTWKQVGR